MASPRVLRSTRNGADPGKVNSTPTSSTRQHHPHTQETTKTDEATTVEAKSTKRAPKKRKQPAATAETQSSEQAKVSEKVHASWYLCPVDDCDAGYAQARPTGPLADHYKQTHPELHKKEPWESSRAQKVDFVKWLNGETKGVVPARMKNKYQHLIYGTEDRGVRQEQPASLVVEASVTVAPAAPIVIEDDFSDPPPAKRRKLDDLLDQQKNELQEFIEQEVREATERADKAEEKLQRLGVERAAEMARDKERMERRRKKMEELEKEIEDEKKFGSSSRLKRDYLHQAKVEAKLCPSRPKHGGFVY